jgi:cyclin B
VVGSTDASLKVQDLTLDVEMDVADAEDTQKVSEYVADIFRHLGERECETIPRDYMDSQPEINCAMRSILVDWLVEVHAKHRLRTETLFLAVNLTDRYLGFRRVTRKKLQLVGVAGMLIAAKFEEIHPPETREFVYITDNAYTIEEILEMEVAMLTSLGFNLCCPTAAHFMERYWRVNRCSEAHCHLFQYILELTLLDYRMIRYAPSHLAAAAAFLSNKLLKQHPSWPATMVRHTHQVEVQIKDCARELCKLVEEASRNKSSQAVHRKFCQAAYSSVARKF